MKKIIKTLLITIIIGCLASAAVDQGLDWIAAQLGIELDDSGQSVARKNDSDEESQQEDEESQQADEESQQADEETKSGQKETSDQAGENESSSEGIGNSEESEASDENHESSEESGKSDEGENSSDSIAAAYSNLKDLPWDLYYYYNTLDDTNKKAYCELLSGMLDCQEMISLGFMKSNEADKLYSQVLADHPELFWVDWSYKIWSGIGVTVQPGYNMPASSINSVKQQIEASAADYLNQISSSMSEYEKVEAVFQYLVDHTEYDVNADQSQNIQSTFLNHVTVCTGYAKATQYLLYQLGIQSMLVTGYAGELHAWNIVKIEGEYYYVDTTWGDPIVVTEIENYNNINYDYLCDTTDEFMLDRTLDDYCTVPECDSTKYNFYHVHGWYYDTYNEITIVNNIEKAINEGNNVIYMKFSDETNYKKAYDKIYVSKGMLSTIYDLFENSSVKGENVILSSDDTFKTIQIQWY